MKSCEEMTRDVLERRDEEVTRIRKRRKGIIGAVSAIVVCVLAVLIIPGLLKHQEAPVGPDSAKDFEDRVVWTTASTELELQKAEFSEGLPEPFAISRTLRDAMDKASADDILAFTLSITADLSSIDPETRVQMNSKRQDALAQWMQKYTAAEDVMLETYSRLTQKIMQEQGVTEMEASVRAENMPQYIAARKDCMKARQEYSKAASQLDFEERENVVDLLKAKGFTILSTCWDDDFCDYLVGECIAVCAGTRELINNLADESFGDGILNVWLSATRRIDDSFYEPPAGKRLRDGSKLTEGLEAKYAENGGAPVRVVVHLGWVGEEVDPRVLAVQSIGLSWEEWETTKDLSDDLVEKYLEALRYYTYWVRPDVVEPMLKEGELVEIQSSKWAFIAYLSYDRALELCEDKMVAYISMDGEAEYRSVYEREAVDE